MPSPAAVRRSYHDLRAALGDVELYHAVKANPHPAVLQVDAPSRDVALARGVADAGLVGAAMLGALLAPWLIGMLGAAGLQVAMAVPAAAVTWSGLHPVQRGRGVADDRGLELEAEFAIQGDGGAPRLLNGQVDVVLGRGRDDPAADRHQ